MTGSCLHNFLHLGLLLLYCLLVYSSVLCLFIQHRWHSQVYLSWLESKILNMCMMLFNLRLQMQKLPFSSQGNMYCLIYLFSSLNSIFNTGLFSATFFSYRLIESSLGSMATKFNFFIHNLAQLRFSGLPSNDEPILSFAPRTYTMKQDGRIRDASIFSFQKRYNPDKHYVRLIL